MNCNHSPFVFDNKDIRKDKPWDDDILERQKYANALNRLAKIATPMTVSVNGKWGTGKTFLLRRWRQELENNGYHAIYYNAWEDDFCMNPVVSVIGQIADALKGGWLDLVKQFKKSITPALTKILLGKMQLSKEELKSAAQNAVDNYAEETAAIRELRKNLTELAKNVQTETNGKPLVFVIDELDRCRPTFAIELLERVKHIFSVPGIMFVLGINSEELQNSIKKVYGDIDAADYLRRFYEYEILLSEPKSSAYCNYLIQEHRMTKFNNHYIEQQRKQNFACLFDAMGLTLRETEHCFRVLCFVAQNGISRFNIEWLTEFLIILKIKNPSLYRQFVGGQCLVKDVIKYFHGFLTSEDAESLQECAEYALYCASSPGDWKKIAEELNKLKDPATSADTVYSHLADNTVLRAKQHDWDRHPDRYAMLPLQRWPNNNPRLLKDIVAVLECLGD